jgi:kynureninase
MPATPPPLSREAAAELDTTDPLRSFGGRFAPLEPGLIYLDGNSLGRPPRTTLSRMERALREEWAGELVRGWSHWIDLPRQVGDELAAGVLEARPGEVVVSDSTSVNLYKLAAAAVAARPGRRVIVTDDDNFPSDRYILQGLAAEKGLELREVASDINNGLDLQVLEEALDDEVAVVSLSHVAYRSGALLDMPLVTERVHAAGALMLWDLAHSAGSVPVPLTSSGADLAVGCTYKYLNAGPGAPAYLYVRRELQDRLQQPLWGWFGHGDQFTMGPHYEPAPGIDQFLVGSPAILQLHSVSEGARLVAEAGIEAVRAKGIALTEYFLTLADTWLAPRGFTLASPREAARRGAHLCLHHPKAWRFTQALIQDANVVPDYRSPERIRFGLAPLTTSFVMVWEALDRLRRIAEARAEAKYPAEQARVT